MTKELKEQIRMLEEQLIHPEIRRDADKLSQLIADDFIEYGNSGHVYRKEDILKMLPNEQTAKMKIEDFHARLISPEVVLLNYDLISYDNRNRGVTHTIRSSIWRLTDGQWQLVYHRGTKK